jgi:hypothetical protein
MVEIDYSENPENTNGYDAIMAVAISNMPLDSTDRFSVRNLKMFVGRKGNRVDVYGNSDHPLAWLIIPRTRPGFDWAFVASSNMEQNIGVAEVGLPPNNLNVRSRNVILGTYSIYNVLYQELYQWILNSTGIPPDSTWLSARLQNAKSPGYFDANGFVQAGSAPSDGYQSLESTILQLVPYNPAEIADLQVSFNSSVFVSTK